MKNVASSVHTLQNEDIADTTFDDLAFDGVHPWARSFFGSAEVSIRPLAVQQNSSIASRLDSISKSRRSPAVFHVQIIVCIFFVSDESSEAVAGNPQRPIGLHGENSARILVTIIRQPGIPMLF